MKLSCPGARAGIAFGLFLSFAFAQPVTPAADDPDESLRRIFTESRVQSPLRLELQRPVDWRLTLLEARGVEGSGLFPGRTHVARNARDVQALSGRLEPGDQLVLAGTDWRDARLVFAGRGTERAPILIRGESRGGVVFTGQSSLTFSGEHLVIMDLTLANVQVPGSGSVLFRLGNGEELPASHCIVNRIEITNCNSPRPEDWPRVRMFYLLERGQNNTIAHSVFADMRHYGQMIAAQNLPADGLQRLHIIGNRFLRRPYVDDQNGYEIIQLGWSGEDAKSAGSLIQGNLFEYCDGETEIITVKASDVVVRHNTFNACQGALTLRTADRVLVQGNVFDGRGLANTGGVRVAGADHVIVENSFRDLKRPADFYHWTVSLMAASGELTADDVAGYGRAKNILIAKNRFDRNDTRIAVGIYPRPEYPLLPERIMIRDNTFSGTEAPGAVEFAAPALPPTAIVESGTRFEAARPTSARLTNLSVRARVGTGQRLIASVVVGGGAKSVLVRAVGPGLAPFFDRGTALAGDLRLELYDATARLVAANENWGGTDALRSAFAAAGTFPLPNDSPDAALLRPIDGVNSVHLVAAKGGMGLLEVYDAGTGLSPRLVNLSARQAAGSGADALMLGFVIAGTGTKTVLIRGIGPALALAPFNLAGTLANPRLEVSDESGRTLAENDDWPPALAEQFARSGAFPLRPDSRDAALLITLPPGSYTAQVTGQNGTAGEALVEVYDVN